MTQTENMTAAEYTARAAVKAREAAESFERSDTDGFLSQWASQMGSAKDRLSALLAEQGGRMNYQALFNLDGTVASTHAAQGQWGWYWVLNDEAAARFGKRFFSESKAADAAKRAKTHAAKGFTLGTINVPAHVTYSGGSGTGLGGAVNVRPIMAPNVDDLKAGNYTIVSATGGDED